MVDDTDDTVLIKLKFSSSWTEKYNLQMEEQFLLHKQSSGSRFSPPKKTYKSDQMAADFLGKKKRIQKPYCAEYSRTNHS
jgi:hypothetical protein